MGGASCSGLTMADDSRKVPKAETLLESDRAAFYAWTAKRGFTRLNQTNDEINEELWRDRQGVMKSAARLVSEYPNWRLPDPEVPAASPPKPAAPSPKPAMRVPDSEEAGRWLRLVPTMALAIIMVGAFQRTTDSRVATAPSHETAQLARGDDLGLTVMLRSNQLEIRWNKASAAITDSVRSVLKITDDGITEALPFDQGRFQEEFVAYTPKTNDVSIRLEVTSRDGGRTSESVRAVTIP
jgi:hypothetical protein